MKSVTLFARSVLILAVLCQAHAFGQAVPPTKPVQQAGPTPTRGKPIPPPTATTPPSSQGRQGGGTQHSSKLPATSMRPVLSIKEVNFSQPPLIKVLVENRGRAKNKPGEIANLYLDLKAGSMAMPDAPGQDMFFWVTGKPKPSGVLFGLTQKQIDALPPTTKIRERFARVAALPPIAPGEAAWVTVDFTLPDPGTLASPKPKSYVPPLPIAKSAFASKCESYCDAAAVEAMECAALTAFFATYFRVVMTVSYQRPGEESSTPPPPSDPLVRTNYSSQLSPIYLQHANIPPGKYTGCK